MPDHQKLGLDADDTLTKVSLLAADVSAQGKSSKKVVAKALTRQPAALEASEPTQQVAILASDLALSNAPAQALPIIPVKRYFSIGEVSELCGVKPYVLRYWEQEFAQLRPMKRRGNRRYYQHHEVLLIRRIRELLYDQGFTISGARNQLHDSVSAVRVHKAEEGASVDAHYAEAASSMQLTDLAHLFQAHMQAGMSMDVVDQLKAALLDIRALLEPDAAVVAD
jgi:DNA-binding transcriptional MerR regulator